MKIGITFGDYERVRALADIERLLSHMGRSKRKAMRLMVDLARKNGQEPEKILAGLLIALQTKAAIVLEK